MFSFVREADSDGDPTRLTCTYEKLVDDVRPGDRVLLADGTVAMRVRETTGDSAVCVVEQPGRIRSRQGVNLPGVALSTPGLTPKDRDDLGWALDNQLDFVGLSFVRSADDVSELRAAIEERGVDQPPLIVSKIEKIEAVEDIERILDVTDAVMVARGDLGVETDVTRVPVLQKQIISLCNTHRVPVITATQMLDSMISNELPTRAEASDVANAIIDGTDAVMLSGETAIGAHPARCVRMMDSIAGHAEALVAIRPQIDTESRADKRASPVTEAVAIGAVGAAEHLDAGLIVVATLSGRTAMALSKQRSRVPILALSDRPAIARRMCLFWGVWSLETDAVHLPPGELMDHVVGWGRDRRIVEPGDRIVLVGRANWSEHGHDMLMIHTVP